jgi:hypothetical protein
MPLTPNEAANIWNAIWPLVPEYRESEKGYAHIPSLPSGIPLYREKAKGGGFTGRVRRLDRDSLQPKVDHHGDFIGYTQYLGNSPVASYPLEKDDLVWLSE